MSILCKDLGDVDDACGIELIELGREDFIENVCQVFSRFK